MKMTGGRRCGRAPGDQAVRWQCAGAHNGSVAAQFWNSVRFPGHVDRARDAGADQYRVCGEPALISASSSAYVHLSLRRRGCGSERTGAVARIDSGLNGTDVRAGCFLLTKWYIPIAWARGCVSLTLWGCVLG